MIPKIIHICWLSGDEFPNNIKVCVESWKRVLPDYEIRIWDTKRFNIDSLLWTRQAFDVKKYAFAADYIRLYALYTEGGIYLEEKKNTTLSKNYTLNKNGFEFSLDLKTEAKGKFNYVIEHNFHFADYEKVLVNGLLLEENGILKNTHILEIEDLFLKKKIIIQMQIPCDIYYFQLKTLSQSEHGFDLSTQGVSFAMKTSFEDSLNIVGSLEVFDV